VLAQVLHGREYWRGLGDLKLLRRYERARKADVLAMGWTTDGLQQLFAQPAEPWSLVRNWGMRGFDRSGPLKHWVVRQAMGRAALLENGKNMKANSDDWPSPAGLRLAGAAAAGPHRRQRAPCRPGAALRKNLPSGCRNRQASTRSAARRCRACTKCAWAATCLHRCRGQLPHQRPDDRHQDQRAT
jgi:hypothetical protein